MTEKDELVEVAKRAYDEAAFDDSDACDHSGIVAAIASIRPTIEHEILRELYRHNKSQLGNWREGSWLLMTEDAFIEFAKSHGLDLTQDGER